MAHAPGTLTRQQSRHPLPQGRGYKIQSPYQENPTVFREAYNALMACVLTFVVCAVAYPAAVYVVGHTLFPKQAEGSLIERDGKVIGSSLIAQPFASEKYFSPRPSAAGATGYAADAASGSNLGTTNPALHDAIEARAKAFGATPENPVPVDLVTASGAGLDPEISPEAARYQAAKVAKARNRPVETMLALIESHINTSGAIIGAPPRVNVLLLNLALDAEPAKP